MTFKTSQGRGFESGSSQNVFLFLYARIRMRLIANFSQINHATLIFGLVNHASRHLIAKRERFSHSLSQWTPDLLLGEGEAITSTYERPKTEAYANL